MNYEIKKVEIGKFKGINVTGKVQLGNTIYNAEKIITKELLCIIDNEKNVAVDITNLNNTYVIIKRNKYNQILPQQNIEENKEYALKLKELKPEDINLLTKIKYNYIVNKYDKQERSRK
ncbi:MAG: hypothetical protein J6K21_02325 [Bacilli bacterium]|nr:hypothetical protein [Bacilli bacterium]